MRTEDLKVGRIYKHRTWPDTEYLAILIQESGKTERKSLVVTKETGDAGLVGKTAYSNSNRDPKWWNGIYDPKSTIKLNEEYSAVVSDDKQSVVVGCQTFDRAIVAKVARAMDL